MTARRILEAATRALKARAEYDAALNNSTSPEAGYFLSDEIRRADELEKEFEAALDAYIDHRVDERLDRERRWLDIDDKPYEGPTPL